MVQTPSPKKQPRTPYLSPGGDFTPDPGRGGDITPALTDFPTSMKYFLATTQFSPSPSPLKRVSSVKDTPHLLPDLPPLSIQYRPSRSHRSNAAHTADVPGASNRHRTAAQIDHDVFEGLPVRRWIKAPVLVGVPPKDDAEAKDKKNDDYPWPELPMPRDSHLLPPHSQALLRAARMGRTTKKATWTGPGHDERVADKELPDAEGEDGEGAGEGGGDEETRRGGFMVRKWVQVPRHLDGPEPEFLAKRRKGLPPLYNTGATSVGNGNSGSFGATTKGDIALPLKKMKVKRLDPETGNSVVYEVLVPDGQTVEGEIIEDGPDDDGNAESAGVMTEAPAPGTIVEGVGVVNAEGVVVAGDVQPTPPPKRRPPPPKRKAKGPGRGRKKKVMFAPGQGADAALVHGESASNATEGGEATTSEAVKQEPSPALGLDGAAEAKDEPVHSGDEDEDDNEEGDDSEDEGEVSGDESKSPAPPLLEIAEPVDEVAIPETKAVETKADETIPPLPRESSNSPDLPLAASAAVTAAPPAESQAEAPTLVVNDAAAPEDVTHDVTEEEKPIEVADAGAEAMDTKVETPAPAIGEVHFEDGEVDLLGSLEASLGNGAVGGGEGEAPKVEEAVEETEEVVSVPQEDVKADV